MAATVKLWTGREVRALRQARRMSLLDFSAHLGVNPRQVSKWEGGGVTITPRPVNQAAFDTSLRRASEEERARFFALIGAETPLVDSRDTDVPEQPNVIRHPGDGKLMTWIPEGIFLSGADDQPVWTEGFWLDVYPTTNADYARFVVATGHRTPKHWDSGVVPGDIADHPVVWVTWDDAAAYASWAGKQLPNSHQWEKAARGTRGNIWPWGSEQTPAKANVRGSGPGTTTPVDNYKSGASAYGVFDLCGGVWEWTDTETKKGREIKGGAFTSLFEVARPSAFNDAAVTMCDNDTGFRCATTTLEI